MLIGPALLAFALFSIALFLTVVRGAAAIAFAVKFILHYSSALGVAVFLAKEADTDILRRKVFADFLLAVYGHG